MVTLMKAKLKRHTYTPIYQNITNWICKNGNTQTLPNILCYSHNSSMLQYKKRKNGNTDHKKEGNLPLNQYFKRKNGNTQSEQFLP